MRLIDADQMAVDESEAYMSAQVQITDDLKWLVNFAAHSKIQRIIADTPTVDAVPVVRKPVVGYEGYYDVPRYWRTEARFLPKLRSRYEKGELKMEFRKYQHIERFGTTEVDGIELGKCYVFPKIDGTNSSVWLGEDGQIHAGSRNRELSLEKDNAGFLATISKDERIVAYLAKHPTHRLFGEWLVPHSLKTYRDDAWRRFYVFDVCVDDDSEVGLEYIPYPVYQPLVEEFGLDYLAPIRIAKNATLDDFIKCLNENNFMIKDGAGVGEGIVIKNYDFYNRYKRQTWAKIVTSEFREKHNKQMGAPLTDNRLVEEDIVDKFVTTAFVEKELAKIVNETGGWSSKMIPRLLSSVYHELICEEMWNVLKAFKNPTINFRALNNFVIAKIKQVKPEIFG